MPLLPPTTVANKHAQSTESLPRGGRGCAGVQDVDSVTSARWRAVQRMHGGGAMRDGQGCVVNNTSHARNKSCDGPGLERRGEAREGE
eukprot:11704-Rhodomonas_salina.1